jgi:MFS transporter, DHA1 family, multidrug resistance protein
MLKSTMAHAGDQQGSDSILSFSGSLSPTSTGTSTRTHDKMDEKNEDQQRSESKNLRRETTDPEVGDNSELQHSTSRSSGLSLNRTVTRRETVLSRIRSRPPVGNFTHPLAHKQTTVEELVEFDGPDDHYMPVNWKMKKKVRHFQPKFCCSASSSP